MAMANPQIHAKKTKHNHEDKPLPTSSLWKRLYADFSPISNTGQKYEDAKTELEKQFKDFPIQSTKIVMTDDGPKPVMFRQPAHGECCVIDWLHVTMSKTTFAYRTKGLKVDLLDDTVIDELNHVCKDLFGFGIDRQLKNGQNYYERAYALENDCGMICIGGQNGTVMISLSGTGCTLANYGWEADLHAWLSLYAVRPKITRIDYAFDDLEGDLISVDWADEIDTVGGFQCGGRPPSVEYKGNWKRPDGSGRSFYIGKRTSSKYCRFYEKGKQLGDKESTWVRCEVELKAKHFHIPLDALVNASDFFLSCYPCFNVFGDQAKAKKFELIQQSAEISWEKAIAITVHQFGKYIQAFRQFYNDDTHLLDLLKPKKPGLPKRLKMLDVDFSNALPDMPAMA